MSKPDRPPIGIIEGRLIETAPLQPLRSAADEDASSVPEEEKITARLLLHSAGRYQQPATDEPRRVQTHLSMLKSWRPQEATDQLETDKRLHEQQLIVLDTVKRLAASEARSELIIETAPDAFIGVDLEGRIVNWNAQATAIFGWTKEEAIGSTLWETIIPPAFHDAHRKATNWFSNIGEAPLVNYRLELSARHRDEHEFPVEITVSGPIQTEAGAFFYTFLRDISTRKRREEELRAAKESAVSQARSLEILNGISREISGLLNIDELLQRIGELLYQLLEYHSFSVLLVDASGENLIHRFSRSDSQVIPKPDVPMDRGLVGFAARTRQPVVVGDVTSDSRYIKFHEETRSELSVPLIAKGKLIGVLDIENRSPYYFRESHVQAVVILASQLAIAIDNAILYDRVSAHEKQLDQDLRFARKLQKQLLTDHLPQMRNAVVATLSWPARIIGGDIFEFAYYPKSELHVGLLGDVTGKGAPAALYAALTSGIIRSLMDQELFPAEMLETLNETLMERPLESHFVALMYNLWDDSRRILYIGNSGLPRPIHYRDGKMKIIEAVGTPLGLLPRLSFDEQRIQSLPGDVFLFPTDGILEATNCDGEEFGYAGVEEALRGWERSSAEEIRDAIASALATHCEEVETRDDQTLIVFKVQNAA